MQIFIYEFVTGGGFWSLDGQPCPEGSLLHEGAAMSDSMSQDLARVPDSQLVTTRDTRLAQPVTGAVSTTWVGSEQTQREAFSTLSRASDLTLVIAPEFDGHLLARIELLERAGCRHANASAEFVALTTDKTALACALARGGVNTPDGIVVAAGQSLPIDDRYPAVLKPNDGAGSMGIQFVPDQAAARMMGLASQSSRLESHIQGMACSVSFLCSASHRVALPPMEQLLSSDGRFSYLGGRRIRDVLLIARATRIAGEALEVLPQAAGYVGVDIVLGAQPNGSQDYVIEINPRLTTSYIGLREIAKSNLAEALLQTTHDELPAVEFYNRPVEFLAQGGVG